MAKRVWSGDTAVLGGEPPTPGEWLAVGVVLAVMTSWVCGQLAVSLR